MSALWKRLHLKAEGSLPGNLVTQGGVAITTILVLGFLTAYIFFGGGEQQIAPAADEDGEQQSPRDFAAQMAARVKTESLRETQRRNAEDRDQQRELMTAGIAGGQVSAGGSPPPAGEINAATGAAYTEEE